MILFFKVKEPKKKEKTNKENDYFKEQRYLSKLLKYETFKKMDKALKEAGYPVKTSQYIMMTFASILVSIIILFREGLRESVIVAVYLFVPLNLFIYKKLSDARNKIRISLCDVQDVFYFQGQIGTPTDIILVNAARVAEEPLKTPLEEASSIYNLRRDIGKALEPLETSFNLMDLKALCMSIRQREETGYSEENHKAQLTMMKRNKRLKKITERQGKRTKLVTCAVLLFLCCTSIVTIPMLTDVLNSINTLLR